MKRILLSIFLVLVFSTASFATRWYNATSLTGGNTGSLDSLNGQNPADGDKCLVVTASGQTYIYNLDDDSALTESSPSVISPDSNAGDKRWILMWSGGRIALPDSTIDQGDSSIVGTIAWHIADAAGDPVTVNLLYGTYKVATKITITANDVWIVGEPGPRPIISNQIAGAASNCIEFTTSDPDDAATFGSGCGIENVTITGPVMTGGAALTVIKHNGFNVENFVALNHPFGIDTYGCRGFMASKFYLYGDSGEALVNESALLRIGPQLNDDASYTVPWYSFFSNFVIAGSYQVDYGIEVNASDGVHFSNGYVASAYDANVQINATIGGTTNAVAIFFDNIYFDGVSQAAGTLVGMTLDEDSGTIGHVEISNCLFGNYQLKGLSVQENSTTVVNVSNCDFTNIGAGAVGIDSTSAKVTITGGSMRNCRVDADSGGVIGAANSSVTIVNGVQVFNTAATAAWGIIWSGTHNQGVVTGCSFENFSGGDIGHTTPTFNDEYKQVGNTTDTAGGVPEYLGAQAFTTWTAADATPSIIGANGVRNHLFYTDSGALTITDFDDGIIGWEIVVMSLGAVVFDTTTAQDASHNLDGSSVNITTAAGDITRWLCTDGTAWKYLGGVDISADNSF